MNNEQWYKDEIASLNKAVYARIKERDELKETIHKRNLMIKQLRQQVNNEATMRISLQQIVE